MRARERISITLLSLTFLATGSAPCPPPPTLGNQQGARPQISHSGAGERHEHASAEAPRHETIPPQALTAPCSCGCGERATASVTGKLGFALLRFEAAFSPQPAHADSLLEILRAPQPMPAEIDHVPLPS